MHYVLNVSMHVRVCLLVRITPIEFQSEKFVVAVCFGVALCFVQLLIFGMRIKCGAGIFSRAQKFRCNYVDNKLDINRSKLHQQNVMQYIYIYCSMFI